MGPATNTILHSKPNSITTVCVPRAHRYPTPHDWERWILVIAARYKSEPARVLIGEMNAEGLLVTEKMFRDRLRQWRMNDKNRRGAPISGRRALSSSAKRDKVSKAGSRYNKTGRNSSRSAMLGHENIHNVLQTPKEMLVLQRTIKGVLDWQQHAEVSMVDLDYRGPLHTLLGDMRRCVFEATCKSSVCGKITPLLQKLSVNIQSYMVKCTPLEILHSVDELAYFANSRNSSPWYYETWRFLVNAAVEIFPDSHPSLLMLRLLLSSLTPSQLVMMYDVGSNIIERCQGEATSFSFRVAMHTTVYGLDLSPTIKSYADAMCAATPDATNSRRLFEIARLYRSTHQYEESADASRKCLAQLEDKGDGDELFSARVLQFLAAVQYGQNDRVGTEMSLQKSLETILVRDRRELHTSQLSIDALYIISKLDAIYVVLDLNEKRDALRLEYRSAFEL